MYTAGPNGFPEVSPNLIGKEDFWIYLENLGRRNYLPLCMNHSSHIITRSLGCERQERWSKVKTMVQCKQLDVMWLLLKEYKPALEDEQGKDFPQACRATYLF